VEADQSTHPKMSAGLIAGFCALGKSILGLALNRVELAALEFSEVRSHFFKLLLLFTLSIVAGWFALAFWSALIIFLCWESLGWKVLFIIAAFFSVIAISFFFYAKSIIEAGKLSMPETMKEFRNDRDALL
jgi:uncharacterized membrane protein YqjE